MLTGKDNAVLIAKIPSGFVLTKENMTKIFQEFIKRGRMLSEEETVNVSPQNYLGKGWTPC